MARLGDICKPKQWTTISADMLKDSGFPVYGANGIIGYYSDYNHEKETLLVTCRGATCGRLNICQPFSYVNGNAMALDELDPAFNLKFLYYYLSHRGFSDVISGSAQPQIIRSAIEKIEIAAIPINKQLSIVSVLETVDSLISLRKQQLAKLDELIKARFVEMFGEESTTVDLIDIIKDGAGLSYGIVQPGDDGTGDMGVLRPVDFVNGKISTISIKYIDRSIGDSFKKTELSGDELLITVRGSTGITALTDNRFKGMNVTRGIAVIRYDRSKINPIYLNAYLNSDKSQRYIQEHTRGATLQQINLSDLRIQKILFPSIEKQNKFADFELQVDKSKAVVQKSLDKLETLKNALMQECFG